MFAPPTAFSGVPEDVNRTRIGDVRSDGSRGSVDVDPRCVADAVVIAAGWARFDLVCTSKNRKELISEVARIADR